MSNKVKSDKYQLIIKDIIGLLKKYHLTTREASIVFRTMNLFVAYCDHYWINKKDI